MIGNAHIDPVWLWRWPEGLAEVGATFRSALDRLDEYPEAIFTASSAAFYAWIERTDPAMFEEIRARVAEGRWAIVGGWWVEADCNLPSGESFVRQALYGQRFFERAFGRIATVGFNPDSFGHTAMLPQILRKSGLEGYVFMRPQAHEAALAGRDFWWEAPDGSRVLASRIVHEYCSPTDDLTAHVDAAIGRLAATDPGWHEAACFYGVGNHGGGPTRANLDGIRRMDASPELPALRHAALDDYFACLQASGASGLPVVRGELQHHARGCYAAHSEVKRLNRSTEQLLLAAETVSAIASIVAGATVPGDFEAAWRALLFNQFHDVLAGTAIESAYDDARDAFGEARSIAARNLHAGLAAIARGIDVPVEPDAWPIVVFNTHAWPVRGPVELEFRRICAGDVLVDEAGQPVPFQLTRSEATVNGGRTRPVFVAELPALGYRVYRLLTGASAAAARAADADPVAAGDTWAETARLRLDVDAASGSFALRRDGRLLLAGAGRAVVYRDESDTWSHGVDRFDERVGEFRPAALRLVEQGPVRAVIRIESRFGDSRLVQDLAVYRDLEAVHARLTLDWREPRHALKLRFGVPAAAPVATYEIPYGALERPLDGAEEPGQAWLDVGGPDGGVSVINDAKYAYDTARTASGGEIGITVARSPIFAHHEPRVPDPGEEYAYLDLGRQQFSYLLLPHPGDWREGGTVRAAAELLQPPLALPDSFHAGPLPQRGSFVSIDQRAVVVSALKRSEDGDALIVRAVETSGEAACATILVAPLARWIDATFGPFEIKTFRVPTDEHLPIEETDLLERPLGTLAAPAHLGHIATQRRRPVLAGGRGTSPRHVRPRSRRS